MYFPHFYKTVDRELIKKNALKEGFQLELVNDKSGDIYAPHSHPETKYLVFLEGEMDMAVDDKLIHCVPGDKVVIPGNVVHSAIVGKNGCSYYWSEKLTS